MPFNTPSYQEAGATRFIDLSDVPGSYSGQGGKNVAVKATEDGLEFVTANGVSFETPTGAINDSNVTFVVLNIPKFIVLNGSVYFENDGYTRSTLTLTLNIVPATGSTLKSAY